LEFIPFFKLIIIRINSELFNLSFRSDGIDNSTSSSIFKKKLNKSKIKKLDYIHNDTGITKHFPPASQE
jgi:hypothetical protein